MEKLKMTNNLLMIFEMLGRFVVSLLVIPGFVQLGYMKIIPSIFVMIGIAVLIIWIMRPALTLWQFTLRHTRNRESNADHGSANADATGE